MIYTEFLCEEGHRYTIHNSENDKTCPICQRMFIFSNEIDDSNFEFVGIIPNFEWDKLKLSDRCVAGTIVKEATYRKPTDKELSNMRYIYKDRLLPSGETEEWFVRLSDGAIFSKNGDMQ